MSTNIVIQCKRCKHQYKVKDNRIGDKFHCFCGELLTVPSVKSHDAAVVRCSSCGGSRGKEQEPYCRYCGSSFTLHERDLNTICPHCMSRISSEAMFCHSCATPIVADTDQVETTQLDCPNCNGHQLHSRQMYSEQSFNLKECSHCAGIWISSDVFEHLEKKALLEVSSSVFKKIRETKLKPISQQSGSYYKKCPTCNVLMNRKNYAQSSGVLIDVCKKHGMWFDINELDKILDFIRSGKLFRHQERISRRAERVNKEKRTSPLQDSNYSHNTVYDISLPGDFASEIIDWLVD